MRAVSHPTFPDQQALPIAALGHGFSEELLRDVLGGITSPGATMDELETCRWVAAVTELDSLNPRTQMEAMLAGQAVVCHHAAMDCFRRANRVDQPDDMAMRLRKTASMMMRSMSDTLRALERLQSRPVPVREPDASEEIIPPATDTDAPERAFSVVPTRPEKSVCCDCFPSMNTEPGAA